MSRLRVASYNLYLGADLTTVFGVGNADELAEAAGRVFEQVLATDFASRATAIARVLSAEDVDVVGLQEVARWSEARDGTEVVWLDFIAELLRALDAAGTPYDVHAESQNFAGGARVGGSRVGGAVDMSVLGHNVVLVRRDSGLRPAGQATGAFERTLEIITPMPDLVLDVGRSWGWVDLEVPGSRSGTFRFVNTHLEAWDRAVRDAQRDELLKAVETTGRPIVVVGDFNEVPEQVGMPQEYVDAWTAAGDGGPGLTCGQAADLTGPSTLDARIDYVWVRGLEVTGCRVLGADEPDRTPTGLWPSDHACVVADLVV